MNTARMVLPAVLLVYFLWRSTRQRIFLLGLPFLMTMYYSIFFDGLKPFWLPYQWSEVSDHMMFWLVVTWIIYFDLLLPERRRSVGERRLLGPRLSGPEELVLLAFLGYMLLRVGLTAVQHMDLGSAISQARVPLYAFVGYFLLRGVFAHAGRRATLDFLEAVVVVNTIAAALFVLHQGFHLPGIYVNVIEHSYIVFGGQILTRSFYFMPQFLPLAIAYCAARRRWSVLWMGVLLVSLGAVWVSYTRALVAVAVVEILLVLVARLLRRGDVWPAVKRAAQIGLIVAVFVAIALAVMPTQSAYLFSRITGTSARGSVAADENVEARLSWWRTTIEWVGKGNREFGMGFPTPGQDGRVTRVEEMSADSVWVLMLWNLGLVGVAGLACVFTVYAWRAATMSFAGDDDAAMLSLVLLSVIVAVFLQGFVQWTVFDPWHTPAALWFLALVAVERYRQRVGAHETVAGVARTVAANQRPVFDTAPHQRMHDGILGFQGSGPGRGGPR